jgi:transposase
MQLTQPTQLMKTKTSITLLSLAAGIVLSTLGGCASVGSTNTESLLSAAGFVVRTPQTDRQKQIYAALPAYKVERATVKDKVFYVYKDEKAGVAYVGHEPEYQRYQQLAVQQQIAQEQYMAAELDRQAALNFYGGFGVRRIWW